MDARTASAPRLFRLLLPALLAGVSGAACTQYVEVIRDRGPQAHYQTGFPLQDASETLARGFSSVKRVQASAVYQTYVFAREEARTEATLDLARDLAGAVDTVSTLRERAATAVVVSSSGGRRLLLTVDHVTHFPDTLVGYFDDDDDRAPSAGPGDIQPRLIESVSVRIIQTNWVLDPPSLEPFEILARD